MPNRTVAQFISPGAKAWLETSEFAYVLHVFEPVVNLVNAESRVLSLVTPRVGNGPFSLVVPETHFTDFIEAGSQIGSLKGLIQIGDLQVDYADAPLWAPVPDWSATSPATFAWTVEQLRSLLAAHADPDSFAQLVISPSRADQPWAKTLATARQPADDLLASLERTDLQGIQDAAVKLAGLGPGLTPAGDDFLVGIMHGLYAVHGELNALTLCLNIADAAIPRTNSLSAAWLEAAARGEAGEPWHQLLAAIGGQDPAALEAAVLRILPTGHTSGADALGGFIAILEGQI